MHRGANIQFKSKLSVLVVDGTSACHVGRGWCLVLEEQPEQLQRVLHIWYFNLFWFSQFDGCHLVAWVPCTPRRGAIR